MRGSEGDFFGIIGSNLDECISKDYERSLKRHNVVVLSDALGLV
jgi:hypothetical protein